MLEPERLARLVNGEGVVETTGPLSGKRLVITAGPTREPIDPVRYITNHSSGKMGYALAGAAVATGAEVVLVSGPVSLSAPPAGGVDVRPVSTAQEMLEAASKAVDEGCDIFIATAAVADYRPEVFASEKIKKTNDNMSLALVRNPPIPWRPSQPGLMRLSRSALRPRLRMWRAMRPTRCSARNSI